MPHFDDSFVSDCSYAESQHIISYSLDRGLKLYQRRKLKSPKFFYTPYRPRVVVKNVVQYSAISSPSTPNSSLSSQSNLVCAGGGSPSPNTPSPATPTSQQSANTPLSGNSVIYQAPGGAGYAVGTSGHKNSLKGTKLARRARSFKDDLIEKISMIRTPNNTLGRSHSPHSPRSKSMKPPPTAEEVAKSASSLENHVKDISNALKHFRDVILKSKLEVLPGNATVILETIASMYTVIQSYALDKHSPVLLSATQQVYQSLGKLVKLCDEVMLIHAARRGDDESSGGADGDGVGDGNAQTERQQLKTLLSEDNVKEIVDLLGDAVRNLATLSQQKLKEREENAFKYAPSNIDAAATSNNVNVNNNSSAAVSHNHLMRLPVEVAGQRTSLPDITLTPKERDILEKTNSNPIRASHSTESILRDTSPPPKPPLPNRPPPLPPKRRNQQQNQQQLLSNNKSMNSDLEWNSDISLGNYGVDYMSNLSVHSHSPDENSSQCSLDSELNHSREEEELKALGLGNRLNDSMLDNDVDKLNISKPLASTGKRVVSHNKVAGNSKSSGSGHVESTNNTAFTTQTQNAAAETAKRRAVVTTSVASDGIDECDFITQSGNGNSGTGVTAADKLEMRKNSTNNRHSNESVWAYMELCQGPNRPLGRHTMHMHDFTGNISHSQTMNIVPLPKDLSPAAQDETPPALPPKNYKQHRKSSATPPTIITTPPPSPKPTHLSAGADAENGRPARVISATQGSEMMSTVCEELGDLTEEEQASLRHSHQLPDENCNNHVTQQHSPLRRADTHEGTPSSRAASAGEDQLLERSSYGEDKCGELQTVPQDEMPKMLEEIDVSKYLVLKRKDEDGPEVKGGYVDALIVHASRVQNDNAFIDAFITTFRTFIQPIDVIEKLTHRYTIFFCCQNDQKQRVARETFSLLMRVVDGLTSMDLTDQLLSLIVEFNYQLVCAGQLYLAKTLRSIFVEKVTLFREYRLPPPKADMHITVTNQPSLLDLKSVEIAEQMTLLDADLFQKIEIPEVLLFAKEQSEEKSPNLNKFTEHFNNMSFWARSKILTLSDAKEREKHVVKFIKIMKHLRKMNNYNSYLALLSALDSAPIRRLEWHKTITQDIKEYCLLIDSSSSFRAYRTTLAATSPPCIPYIGLVLQDLTFVHVGNPDYLKEGVINFSKRWQQYHLIENMKRFKKCEYNFRRNERIIRFFDNFEYELGEEEMWQISESIKPRGRRPVQA
ncbi:guanine nucleotide-releasing factor 2 isoform X6 [Ceratitis capitata]|uniref:guanine nucleotide-releasing factor 2 isoform X6 n=1 Tax=Ceratitis capitata TaxID=7213 RepID=UPI00032976D9|nr:guanine nucleotide-releasing factor 2 isoform X6 [Ceratitis capitata]